MVPFELENGDIENVWSYTLSYSRARSFAAADNQNLDPVPEAHIGELLYVCVGPERLEVFDRGVHRLAELARIPDGWRSRSPRRPAPTCSRGST